MGTGEATAIEGLETRTDISAGEGRFLLNDYGWDDRPQGRRRSTLSFQTARISAPTEAFALMFETHQTGASMVEVMGPGAFSQFLTRATSLYEMTARIIAGTHEKRGETINRYF